MAQKSDQRSIYDQFDTVTRQTQDLLQSVNGLSEQVTKLLAENVKLTIENEHLRQQLAGKQQKDDEGLSNSRKVLQRLYQVSTFAMICMANDWVRMNPVPSV